MQELRACDKVKTPLRQKNLSAPQTPCEGDGGGPEVVVLSGVLWSFVVGVGGVIVVLMCGVVVAVVLLSDLGVVDVVMDVVGKVSPSGRKYVVSKATKLHRDMFPNVRMPVLSYVLQ